VSALPVIEHGEGRSSRWLRNHRLRVAILVALVETALVVGNVIGWYIAVGIATVVLLFHFLVGRKSKRPWLRQLSWAAAVSQALPIIVPFAALAVGALLVLSIVGALFAVLAYIVFGRRSPPIR
jgi:hypothetical protein